MRILKAQPIRHQLIAAVCAVLLPFAIVVIWSANRTRAERDAEVQEQAGSIATTAAAYLNQYLTGLGSMASALVRHPAVITLDRPQVDPLLVDVLHNQPLLLNVVLSDTNGTIKGSAIPSPLTSVTLPYVKQVVASGNAVVGELATGPVSGRPTVVLAYPVRDASQAVAGVLGIGLNLAQLQDAFITMASNLRETHEALDRQVEQERKMREMLQSLQRQVVRQERLAAVGILVSGVAHELNNPLQAILGTAELLERHQTLTPEALEELAFLKTQSGRAREIIRNLSRFSSQQSGPPALVDLRDVVAEVVQLRGRDLDNSSIPLDVDASSARKVYANFTEVEQVTLNFVINAQQSIEAAGRQRGRILICVYDAGKKVRLEVQDDGPGVAPEDEPKLFQPFFTTKPVGKGTGLGLSVNYGIIESYGGAIGYHGNPWGGATFFFELPTTDPAVRPRTSSGESTGTDDPPPVLHGSVSSGV